MKKNGLFTHASTCMFWGFFFSLISIDIGILATIETILATALFLQGTSMLRKKNSELRKAWIVSCLLAICVLMAMGLASINASIASLMTIICVILRILLFAWYFSGLKEIGKEYEVTIPQCQRIVIEYLIITLGFIIMALLPPLILIGLIVYPVMNIVMVVQIYRVHKQIKATDPTLSVSSGLLPTPATIILYCCVCSMLIVGESYVLSTKDTIVYQEWATSLEEERAALIEKAYPKDLVSSLSDEDVKILIQTDTAVSNTFYQNGNRTIHTMALSKDKQTLYVLVFFHIDESLTKAHASFDVVVNQSGQSAYYRDGQQTVLYDDGNRVMGYKDKEQFQFSCHNKTNQRGYALIPMNLSDDSNHFYEVITRLWYEDHWLQYPYETEGLLKAVNEGEGNVYSTNYRNLYNYSTYAITDGTLDLI